MEIVLTFGRGHRRKRRSYGPSGRPALYRTGRAIVAAGKAADPSAIIMEGTTARAARSRRHETPDRIRRGPVSRTDLGAARLEGLADVQSW